MLPRRRLSRADQDVGPPTHVDVRVTRAALALVLTALVLLVLLPILGDRAAAPLHEEMREIAEPGRGHLTRIQLAIALEGAALRDYAETGDSSFVLRYERALDMERAAYEALDPLVRRLGPAVRTRFDELLALQQRWHDAADASMAGSAADGGRAREPVAGVPGDEDLFEEVLVAAARLDEAIDAAAQERRGRILDAERAGRRMAVVLGGVAFAATVAVAWLGMRVRAHAAEAERQHRELQQAVESRARLMRGVGHDLKNPLNAIEGHAALLEDGLKGPLTSTQAASVRRIRTAVRTLLSLIEDLLELGRAEAGQLRVEPQPVDLCSLVRDSVEEHRAAAEAAGHLVRCDVAGECEVDTDPDRVRQILGNLLSNAVKYTPPGGTIVVRASLRGHPGAPYDRRLGRSAVIEVQDSGTGIPGDKLDLIFEEFARLQPHAKPGAGLGLAIARRVATLLGGELTVESTLGVGSTFALRLPARDRPARGARDGGDVAHAV